MKFIEIMKNNIFLLASSSLSFFIIYFDSNIEYVLKYICIFNIMIMMVIIIILLKNIRNENILNFSSFILLPFFIHLILLNVHYNIIELKYFNNIIINIINGFISIVYMTIISIPYNLLSLINIDEKLKTCMVILWGTIIVNIFVKIFVNLDVNNFKYKKDKRRIIFLAYLQSSSFIVFYYSAITFVSSWK
jgi:hypothetical protein